MTTHTSPVPADVRLTAHFTVDQSTDGCWNWTGALSSQGGYPGFTDDHGDFIYAHRLMYTQTYGPIPGGFHVHHTCGSRVCINPNHLEALSPEEHRARHATECRRQRLAKGSYYMRLRDSGLSVKQIAAAVKRHASTVTKLIREARSAANLQLEVA